MISGSTQHIVWSELGAVLYFSGLIHTPQLRQEKSPSSPCTSNSVMCLAGNSEVWCITHLAVSILKFSCNPMKINKVTFRVLHLGQGYPQYSYRVGDDVIESSRAEKDLGRWKMRHDLATCACSPENQSYQGCIKRKVVSRSKEVILALYSCSGVEVSFQ